MKHTTLKENNFDFFLDKRGFYYLYVREGEDFVVEDVGKVIQYIQSLENPVRAPFLVELGYGCTFGEGVLEIFATLPNRFSTADALITDTFAHKLLAKFYMRHYQPPTPTAIFDTKDEAMAWLQPYLNRKCPV